MSKEKTIELIFSAIDELNQLREAGEQIPMEPDVTLFGVSGRLDSLALVSLILDVEERLSQEYGVSISLADDRAMSQRNSPFRTAAVLADYIESLLANAGS